MRFIKYALLFIVPVLLILSCANKNNKLKLLFAKDIQKQDIKIRMEVLGGVPGTEIFNGQTKYSIPNGYGENEWYFSCHERLKGYLRHIKTNANDSHEYNFSFYKNKEKVFVDVDIKGDSPLKATVELK